MHEVLTLLLPDARQTAMLRTITCSAAERSASWAVWQDEYGGPQWLLEQEPDGAKRLLPQFWLSLAATTQAVSDLTRTYLRTAHFREQLRHETVREIAVAGLEAIVRAGIAVVVLRGVVLAEVEYAERGLRHCHDCDVLVEARHIPGALASLSAAGFDVPEEGAAGSHGVAAAHSSGMRIVIHGELFHLPAYTCKTAEVLGEALPLNIEGVAVAALSPELSLLHVLGHAASSTSRRSLLWVTDSMAILRRHPKLDWAAFCARASSGRLALPLHVMLGYLARDLQAPIPGFVLQNMEEGAESASAAQKEAAFYGVLEACRVGDLSLRAVLDCAPHWRARLRLWRLFVAPSLDILCWRYALKKRWMAPGLYPLRAARALLYRCKIHR